MKKFREKFAKHKVRNIILLAILVIVVVVIVSSIISGKKGIPVTTVSPSKSDIEELVSVSGKVVSGTTETYYAKFACKVDDIVPLGTAVNSGDSVVIFDPDELATVKQKAELQTTVDDKSYAESQYQNAVAHMDLDIGNIGLSECKQLIQLYEQQIKDLDRTIESKQKDIDTTLAARTKQIAEGDIDVDEEEAVNQLNFDKATAEYDNNLTDMKHELEDKEDVLSKLKEREAKLETSESGSGLEAKKASYEIKAIDNQDILDSVMAATDGVKAPFNGVISAVNVLSGAETKPGEPVYTLASLDDVYADVNMSKMDIGRVSVGQKAEVTIADKVYEGTVESISNFAGTGENGNVIIAARVKIDNPDNYIVIGLDTKVKIHGQSKKDALTVPSAAVNADIDGDFVYVVENGIVVRKDVTLGISTVSAIEVIDGLSENDVVITQISNSIVEGIKVYAVPDMEAGVPVTSASDEVQETTAESASLENE